MKPNPNTRAIEFFTRIHFQSSGLPHWFLKFIQELNHFLAFHDQVAEPVVADAVFELVRKYKLTVLYHRFEVFEGDVGVLS